MKLNDKVLTRAIEALTTVFIVGMVTLVLVNEAEATELDLTLSRIGNQGYETKFSAGNDDWYAWASYGEERQTIITQSAGDITVAAVGIGYRWRPFYLDAGLAAINGTYDDRIFREAVWFSFCPTFCPAHWQPDENYLDPDITVDSDWKQAPMIRLGFQPQLTDRLSLDFHFRYLHAEQDMNIINTTRTEQGWWEGTFKRDRSAVGFGVNWRF